MTTLHQCVIPDVGKEEVSDAGHLTCIHCDKVMQAGDAFTANDDGYFDRLEFQVCTPPDKG